MSEAVKSETTNGVGLPHDMPVDPEGDAKVLLEKLGKFGGTSVELTAEELAAAQASSLTGVPMKASNMLAKIAEMTPEQVKKLFTIPYFAALFAQMTQQASAPPAAAQASQHVQEAQPAHPAGASEQAGAEDPAEVEERIRAAIASMNRARVRPGNFELPVEEVAQRIFLDLSYEGAQPFNEDFLVPAESAVVIVGTVPEGVSFELGEVRKIQLHPFALDRLLVAGVVVDGVQIAGQGPATVYGRSDGAPFALMGRTSTIRVRIRNLTRGPVPIAASIQIVPLQRLG